MYAIALRRVSNAQMGSRVTLRVGDALTPPFPSAIFDAIFLSFTLELFDTPEIPVLLHQCLRLLKPNGRMGVVAIAKRHPTTWIQRLYEALHHYFPQWIDCRPIYTSQLLQDHGFLILEKQVLPMFGLQVELVTAKKR
jgi:demethylmenaquinone methyltransferase/2-methoxy-6-polyprenyl-1,4-benzoquinol methylase